jgi:hypothetical protein
MKHVLTVLLLVFFCTGLFAQDANQDRIKELEKRLWRAHEMVAVYHHFLTTPGSHETDGAFLLHWLRTRSATLQELLKLGYKMPPQPAK